MTLAAVEPEDTILKLLATQSEAWNRGDIPAFMETYDNSPQTVYAGATGITKGYAEVLARYREKYSSREQMGTLQFSSLEVRMLTADVATVTGRFSLTREASAGGDASGWFSLVLCKRATGWKIVHDHTS